MYKKYYKDFENAEKDAKKYKCDIIEGYVEYNNRFGNYIYYLVPKSSQPGVVIARKQLNYYYKIAYKFTDGHIIFISDVTPYRYAVILKGKIPEEKIYEYAKGYYTRREETSRIIKERKENARISHALCDLPGKEGHKIRQSIRHDLKKGYVD